MSQAAKFRLSLLAILAGAAAVYLVGNQRVALWDRDEPWYAQCSREMFQSGDWVVPKFLGQWRMEKPPLVYWCQVACMYVLGDTNQAVRLPSTVAILATALVFALVVRKFVGVKRALWAAFIFCFCGLAVAAAKFCITDATMLLFVAVGQACLGILYACHIRKKRPPAWPAPLFWISVGLASLTKGPQALGMHVVMLLILAALEVGKNFRSIRAWRSAFSWWRFLNPLVGIPLLAIVVAPWLILIHQRAPGFIDELFHKAELHSATSMEGHGQPPGYHALLILGTFFPWSLLLPTAITIAWKKRKTPHIRFAIAAFAGPWLLMECVKTKLPFYVLPAFPGLAFLTADAVVRCARGQFDDLTRKAFAWVTIVWAIACLVLSNFGWLASWLPLPIPVPGFIAFSVCGALYVLFVLIAFAQKRIGPAVVAMGVGMGILMFILYSAIFPDLQLVRLSERLDDHLISLGAYGKQVQVSQIGYQEPSVPYYLGGGARIKDPALLRGNPALLSRWIAVDFKTWRAVPPDKKANYKILFSEWGLNYSMQMQFQTVLILENPAASRAFIR